MTQNHLATKSQDRNAQILSRVYGLILSWSVPQESEPAAEDLGRSAAAGSTNGTPT